MASCLEYLEQVPKLVMVSRDDWGAQPAARDPTPMTSPVGHVKMWYLRQYEPCYFHDSCTDIVRGQQKRDINTGLSNIQYNFVIGQTGDVYEGRGWTSESSHILPYAKHKGDRIDIAIIGRYFNEKELPKNLLDVTDLLIKEGIKKKFIAENYQFIDDEKDPHPERYHKNYIWTFKRPVQHITSKKRLRDIERHKQKMREMEETKNQEAVAT